MSVSGLGSASGELLIDIAQAMANLTTLENRVKSLSSTGGDTFKGAEAGGTRLDALGTKLDGVNRKYGELGKVGLGVGVATAAAFGLAINSAANFEQGMSNVSAALGGVGGDAGLTKDQFAALSDEALRIGASTSVSAGEASQAMELLAKSGLSATQILEGGAAAVVSISEATGESIQQSSESFGALTNLFEDTGISAAGMADAIVVGMNNSNATLSEFQTGIARLAPVIAQTGLSFNDSAAAIAYFNSRGFSAAEVGTSLTRAFNDLVNPIDGTGEALRNAGISAFDAQGNFVGFPAIMDQVAAATEGMTDAQKAAFLSTIFSADAIDLMADASKTGGGELDALSTKTEEQGVAADQAAERMNNFKGALEQLKGAIGSLAIVIGTPFLGPLRAVAEFLARLVEGFLKLPPSIQTAISAVVGIAGALVGLAGAIVVFGPQVAKIAIQLQKFGQAALRLIPALLGLSLPILLIVAALALLAAAYHFNLFGFRDAVNSVASTVADKLGAAAGHIKDFAQGVKSAFDAFRSGGQNPVQAAFNAIGLELDALGAKLGPFGGIVRGVASGFRFLGDFAGRFERNFARLGKNVNPVAGVLKAFGATLTQLSSRFGVLGPAVKALGGFFTNMGKVAGDVGDILQAAFAGDWAEVLDESKSLVGNLGNAFIDLAQVLPSAALGVMSGALGGIGEKFTDLGNNIGGPFGDALTDLGTGFRNAGEAVEDVQSGFGKLLDGDISGALEDFGSAAGNVGQAMAGFGGAAVNALSGAWDALSGVDWGGVLDTIGSGLSDAAGFALDFGSKILDAVTDALPGLDELATMAGTFATDLGSAISTAIEGAADFAVNIGSKLLNEIQDALPTLGELASMAGEFASDIGSAISTAIETAADFAVNIGSKLLAELQDAFPKVGELLTIASGFALDLMQSISDAIANAVDFAAGIGSKILAEITDAMPTLGELASVASTLAQNLASSISQAISTAVNFAASIGQRILEEITDAMPTTGELASIAATLASNLGTAITTGISGMKDFATNLGSTILSEFSQAVTGADFSGIAGDLVDKLISAFADLAPGWLTDALGIDTEAEDAKKVASLAGRDIADSLRAGIDESLATAKNSFASLTDPMTTSLRAVADQAIATGTSIGSAATTITTAMVGVGVAVGIAVSSITTNLGLIATPAAAAGTALSTLATSANTAMVNMGVAVGTAVSSVTGNLSRLGTAFNTAQSTITAAMNTARGNVTSAANTMTQTLNALAVAAGQAGQRAGSDFQRGIENGMRNATSAAQNARSAIIAALDLPDMYSEGYSTGASLGSGLAAGLNSALGAVQSAASALASAAASALNAAAQVASPSRLTMKTGRWMAEGLVIGMERGTPAVVAAFADLIPYPDLNAMRQFGNMPVGGNGAVSHVTVLALKSEDWLEMVKAAETGRDFANEFPYTLGGRR
jgi:TP901 family phage tail tape measure protein